MIFGIFVMLLSCKSNEAEKIYQNEVRIEILDSIAVKGSGLVYASYLKEKYLFYSPFNQDIVLYDFKSNESLTFNNSGRTPEEYLLLYHNICFKSDSSLAVGTLKGFNEYTLDGKFLNSYEIQRSSTMSPLLNLRFVNPEELIFLEIPQGNTMAKEFYENDVDVLRTVRISSQDVLPVRSFAVFPDHESSFVNTNSYYIYPAVFFMEFIEGKNIVSLANKNDPFIFEYDVASGKKVNSIKLNLQKYEPIKIKFGEYVTEDEMDFLIYQNSSIQGFYFHNGHYYVQYTQGYSHEELKELARVDKTFPKFTTPDLKFRINFIKDNIVYDFQTPHHLGKLVNIEKGGEFIFQKRASKYDEDNNVTILYKTKISF